MNSFEMNKILGAVLGTCLGIVAVNIAAGAVFAPKMPQKPGYEIAIPKDDHGQPKEQPKAPEPIEPLLANADPARGQSSAQKCAACHTFDKGGRALVGPNLWGVVGRKKASVPGFNYSPALKAMQGNWTIQDLNVFIANPKGMVPGTAMTFDGVPRAVERADVLAYLNSLSDSPAPLPKAAEAPTGARTE
jgi:cytochrome c